MHDCAPKFSLVDETVSRTADIPCKSYHYHVYSTAAVSKDSSRHPSRNATRSTLKMVSGRAGLNARTFVDNHQIASTLCQLVFCLNRLSNLRKEARATQHTLPQFVARQQLVWTHFLDANSAKECGGCWICQSNVMGSNALVVHVLCSNTDCSPWCMTS